MAIGLFLAALGHRVGFTQASDLGDRTKIGAGLDFFAGELDDGRLERLGARHVGFHVKPGVKRQSDAGGRGLDGNRGGIATVAVVSRMTASMANSDSHGSDRPRRTQIRAGAASLTQHAGSVLLRT